MTSKQSTINTAPKKTAAASSMQRDNRAGATHGQGPTHEQIAGITGDTRHMLPTNVLMLQRSIGNRAVARVLGRDTASPTQQPIIVQPKLKVGPAVDVYEIEADKIANQVVRSPASPRAQRARDEKQDAIQRTSARPSVQRAAPIGLEGGALDAKLEGRLKRAESGGRAMPTNVRRAIEPKLGADLSPVRVHTDRNAVQMAQDLGAKAFTHKNHIYYGAGQNVSDLQLTTHESVHTIQQGAIQTSSAHQRVSRKVARETDLQTSLDASAGLIQRTPALVRQPVTSRVWLGRLDNLSPKKQIKAVSGGTKGREYNKFDSVDLEDQDTRHVKDKGGNIVWYRIRNTDAFIPASNVITGIDPTQGNAEDPDIGGEDAASMVEAAGKLFSPDNELVEYQQGMYKLGEQRKAEQEARGEEGVGLTGSEAKESAQLNKGEAVMWVGGSAIGVASGIMGMAAALKGLNEKGAWNKVDATFDYFSSAADTIGSLAGTMGAISSFVNQGAEEGSKMAATSSELSSWGAGYQSMFGALSNGIKTVKGIADLVHMIYEEKTGKAVHDRDTYLNTVSGILTGALGAVRSVLTSIRTISQLVHGGVMDVLDNIIPGLDIAVAAIDIIFEGYYLIESAVHHWWMKTRKKELKTDLAQEGHTKDDIKGAQKFYAHGDAQKANMGNQIAKNTKSNLKTDKKLTKTTDQEKLDKLTSKKVGREAQNVSMGIDQGIVEDQMQQHETDSGLSRDRLTEYSLVSELKDVNKKRIVRQSIHIGSNLMKIAGSITALVAGPGAPAGIALKAAAVGIDVSLPIARSLKQWGRNKAARKQAKGEDGKSSKVFNKIFNADKSTTAKLTHRKKQAVAILLRVSDLNSHLPLGNSMDKKEALAADIRIVERYIQSAGCSPKRLYKSNGNPAEQVKILVEALSKRELS